MILTTLLLQGLTLPWLIRKMKFPMYKDYLPEEEADQHIRKGLAAHSLDYLHAEYPDALNRHRVIRQYVEKWQKKIKGETDPLLSREARIIYLDLLEKQRQWLLQKNKTENKVDEEVIRKHLRQIDVEEERLRCL